MIPADNSNALAEIGGEPLTNSGFESERPDDDFIDEADEQEVRTK